METKGNMRLFSRILRPFQRFVATEASSGLVLLICAIVALVWSNSPMGDAYFGLWEQKLTVGVGRATLSHSLHDWINDGLMVIFFLLVGLEIKRELFVGELSSLKRASLPIAAAVGGMLVPAAIYVMFTAGSPGVRGWGIPMATDIAFSLGVVALLGDRVPLGLRVFLAALAIVDDIGAVLVIAMFYTADVSVLALGGAAVVFVVLLSCNMLGVRHLMVYAALGVLLWLCILSSGVHATIAGVLLAAAIPARTRIDESPFGADAEVPPRELDAARSPLLRLEHRLHVVVAFLIMPLFALANGGVRLSHDVVAGLSWPVVLGVWIGLVAGKVTGISMASFAAIAGNLAILPVEATRRSIVAISWLGGIGFTMSLFVASLAFDSGPLLDSAKVGILGASICAGSIGAVALRLQATRRDPRGASMA